MRDLNELWYYALVVQHGGFSAASRATGVSKSTLSKGIARLEDRLHVRLIERSSRRLRVSELGQEFYAHCQAMVESVDMAEALAADALAEPQGRLRMSCPPGLLQELLAALLPRFLLQYPKVRLQVSQLNRFPDLIEEGIDLAVGVREIMEIDESMIARELGTLSSVLVASPEFLHRNPVTDLEDLSGLPVISMIEDRELQFLNLRDPACSMRRVELQPRLFSSNLAVLREAALQHLGIALLPTHSCSEQFARGELVDVLPGWSMPTGTVLAVYASRKGLRPSVRALIEWLTLEMRTVLGHGAPVLRNVPDVRT
jgi:DNA-binding transcriptional LysR family regulator